VLKKESNLSEISSRVCINNHFEFRCNSAKSKSVCIPCESAALNQAEQRGISLWSSAEAEKEFIASDQHQYQSNGRRSLWCFLSNGRGKVLKFDPAAENVLALSGCKKTAIFH